VIHPSYFKASFESVNKLMNFSQGIRVTEPQVFCNHEPFPLVVVHVFGH
jgi:hypothetical protein